ncbi:MAG: hypothetical protein OEM32_06290 [Acidimicrobiia bacterium]|nr:hypothetical protein [Acidimicrobiia bacterium]
MVLTYTWEGSGATDHANCSNGNDFNENAVATQTDTTSLTASVAGSASREDTHTWTTTAGNPGSDDWPSGDYTVEGECDQNQVDFYNYEIMQRTST